METREIRLCMVTEHDGNTAELRSVAYQDTHYVMEGSPAPVQELHGVSSDAPFSGVLG